MREQQGRRKSQVGEMAGAHAKSARENAWKWTPQDELRTSWVKNQAEEKQILGREKDVC